MAMFETQEVKYIIPEVIRNALWIVLANLKQPSFSHHFELKTLYCPNGTVYQNIIHTQKGSVYRKEFKFKTEVAIDDMTVYIVGFEAKWLMLLQP